MPTYSKQAKCFNDATRLFTLRGRPACGRTENAPVQPGPKEMNSYV
jgi:hypothetical protein